MAQTPPSHAVAVADDALPPWPEPADLTAQLMLEWAEPLLSVPTNGDEGPAVVRVATFARLAARRRAAGMRRTAPARAKRRVLRASAT